MGDAYLVASGVPEIIRNHATEISKMALDLLSKVKPKTDILDLNDTFYSLKI